jgi:hypothetical protein
MIQKNDKNEDKEMCKFLECFSLGFFYCFKLIITLGFKFCLHVSCVKHEK